MSQAALLGFDWVLTLDQDSICCLDMVDKLALAAELHPSVALVSPFVVDINQLTLEEYSKMELPEYEYAVMRITSGSLTNVPAVKKIGMFYVPLFIDQVDHDLCLRLRRAGYEIIVANRAWLLHEVGKTEMVYIAPSLGKLTGIKWFSRPKYISNHLPIRVYYQTRNLLYMLRKYGGEYTAQPMRYWLAFCRGMCLRFLFEDRKIKKILAFTRGFFAGIMMKTD